MWSHASDVFIKAGIWLMLVVGLGPSLYILVAAFWSSLALATLDVSERTRIEAEASEEDVHIYTHHLLVQVGSMKLKMWPRLWAAFLASAGIVCVVIGLLVLLHVPTPPTRTPFGGPP